VISNNLQVFDASGFPVIEPIRLSDVIRSFIETLPECSFNQEKIVLELLPEPSQFQINGNPRLLNLCADYGYVRVIVLRGENIIYQHPHSIEEVIAMPLQKILNQLYPKEETFAFSLFNRPSNAIKAIQNIEKCLSTIGKQRVKSRLKIHPIEEPPLAEASLEDFKFISKPENEAYSNLKIILHESVYLQLYESMPLSHQYEEGGFLLGFPYTERGSQHNYLLEITHCPKAEQTGASFFHITFTGESFAAVKRLIRQELPSHRLLGWYHTHLFPATEEMGLSSIDVNLHSTTFRIPWQVAGLVNLDRSNRTLRFYSRKDGYMSNCPFGVVEDK